MSVSKVLGIISFIFLSVCSSAYAENTIEIDDAWSPEAPPVVKVMAGYMVIKNKLNSDITIKSASSPLFNRVEIHLTEMKDGIARMVKQENLTIKANQSVELKPNGLHMMLMGRKQPISKGSKIPVTLVFNNNISHTVKLSVKNQAQDDHSHHHHH